jgi:hypothetical protein
MPIPSKEEDQMKYVLQIYGNITRDELAALPQAEQQRIYAAWGEIQRTPGMQPGYEMAEPATATTVKVKDGETLVTDGPFPQVKEALGGVFTLEADDLDAAIALAAKIPTVKEDGAVEIRPWAQR